MIALQGLRRFHASSLVLAEFGKFSHYQFVGAAILELRASLRHPEAPCSYQRREGSRVDRRRCVSIPASRLAALPDVGHLFCQVAVEPESDARFAPTLIVSGQQPHRIVHNLHDPRQPALLLDRR